MKEERELERGRERERVSEKKGNERKGDENIISIIQKHIFDSLIFFAEEKYLQKIVATKATFS